MKEWVSADFVVALARYGDLPLDRERARAISEILGPAVAKLRAIRPAGYPMLAPDINFRVPVPSKERGHDDPTE